MKHLRWYDEDGEIESDTVLEKGKKYRYEIELWPKQGCEFSKDVVVTVGGEPLPDTLFKTVSSTEVRYGKLYVLDDTQLIDKVEITVDKPEIGKEGGKPSVAEDAPYELDEDFASWSVADSNDIDELDDLEGVFEEGQHAWLVTALFAKEGYLFADNVEVYINGKKIDLDGGVTAMYDGSMMICANYMGQPTKEGAPPTADNAQLMLWSVMLTVSALGAAYVVSKKRYAK